jgi:hypothetical protein
LGLIYHIISKRKLKLHLFNQLLTVPLRVFKIWPEMIAETSRNAGLRAPMQVLYLNVIQKDRIYTLNLVLLFNFMF